MTQFRRSTKLFRACWWLCLALLLGCAERGPQKAFGTYEQRLANTLGGEESLEQPLAALPRRPRTSELLLQHPPGNLGALDFLALSGCELQVTIGKRNSSLGIFASESQRLLLELEYLQHAPACITSMRQQGKREIANTLAAAQTLKKAQLPGLIYNATLANVEFEQFWRKPTTLGSYPKKTSSAVLSALAAIGERTERWLSGDYRADNKGFEILLSEVAKGDGGALLLALTTQEAGLSTANRVLHERLDKGPLCRPGHRPVSADILPNVIRKYFIDAIQPWSADLGRRYHALAEEVWRLETLLEAVLPPPYLDWQQSRQAALSRLVTAPKEHVALLQRVLAPCADGGP